MKKLKILLMKIPYKLLIIMVLIPLLGFSFHEDLPFTKQKTINKAYFVNPDAGINVENMYGNIRVSTWDENKIELDILIKVSGDSEKWVEKRINDIDVKIDAFKNNVNAKTIIESADFYNNGNTNSFEINYVIKIPKNGSVKFINKYGNIIADDLNANVSIICKYGKIILGKLNGNLNIIELGYCPNSTIEFAKSLIINAKYSGLKINEVSKLNLDSNYTDVIVTDCQSVNYDSNYGKLNFSKVNTIVGSGNYMTLNIGELFNSLNVNTNYSKINIISITEKANNVNIDSGYSNLNIGFDSNYAFDLDVQTKYGDVRYDSEIEVFNKEITNNSKQINGFYKQKGANKINLKTKYGNINLIKK